MLIEKVEAAGVVVDIMNNSEKEEGEKMPALHLRRYGLLFNYRID